MKSILKITALLAISLVLLACVALAVLITQGTPEQYKQSLETQLSDLTGRKITIAGPLKWALLPMLSLKAEDVSMANRSGFTDKPFITAKTIELKLKLVPLLEGELVIGKVALIDAQYNLKVLSNGSNNWSDLSSPVAEPQTMTQSKSSFFAIKKINIDAIVLINNSIHYDDEQKSQHYNINGVDYHGRIALTNVDAPIHHEHKLPIETLRKLDSVGTLFIQTLEFNRLHLDKVTATLEAAKGVVTLRPLKANWYKGTLHANWQLDVQNELPSMTLKAEVKKVDLTALFSDLKYTDKITGQMAGKMDITSKNVEEAVKSLNGTVHFDVVNGDVHGINLLQTIQQITALANREFKPSGETSSRTHFKSLTADVSLTNGVANNDNLLLIGDGIEARGNGTANLVNHTFNLNVKAKLVSDSLSPKILKAQDCLGGEFPINVTGTFNDYKTNIEYTELIAQCAIKKVIEHLGDVTKDTGKETEKAIKGMIKNILGN